MNPDDFKKKRGGPAFPLPLGTGNCSEPAESGGMDLRDYFAAKAFSMLMHPDAKDYTPEETARKAYRFADAMLAAREAQ